MKTFNFPRPADNDKVKAEVAKKHFLSPEAGKTKAAIEARTAINGADRRSTIQDAVTAVLDGGTADIAHQPTTGELTDKLRILTAAIETQERRIADAEHAASVEIATKLKGEYERECLAPMKKAIVELRALAEKELAFRRGMADAGISYSAVFRTMPFTGRIDGNEPTHLPDAWLHELATYYPALA
jgi:hypothetical protein